MSAARRDGDKELFETIGQVREFMVQYQRDRTADMTTRGEDREDTRKWREEFTEKQSILEGAVGGLKERLDNLTAPARWAIGAAAIVTALGAFATFGKKFLIWIRALMG